MVGELHARHSSRLLLLAGQELGMSARTLWRGFDRLEDTQVELQGFYAPLALVESSEHHRRDIFFTRG